MERIAPELARVRERCAAAKQIALVGEVGKGSVAVGMPWWERVTGS